MGTNQFTKVTVQAIIQAPVEKVWRYWTEPEHITQWYQASDTWHAPKADNDLRVGGEFMTRMEANQAGWQAIVDSFKSYGDATLIR